MSVCAPFRTRAGMGRGEDKRYLSLIFNPSISLPLKGKREIEGKACIRTLERVVLRTPIRPDLHRPAALRQGFFMSQMKNRESGTDSATRAPRNDAIPSLKAAMADVMASLHHHTDKTPLAGALSHSTFAPLSLSAFGWCLRQLQTCQQCLLGASISAMGQCSLTADGY